MSPPPRAMRTTQPEATVAVAGDEPAAESDADGAAEAAVAVAEDEPAAESDADGAPEADRRRCGG